MDTPEGSTTPETPESAASEPSGRPVSEGRYSPAQVSPPAHAPIVGTKYVLNEKTGLYDVHRVDDEGNETVDRGEDDLPAAEEAGPADPDYDLTTAIPDHVPPHLRDDPATVTALGEVSAMAKEAGVPAKTARLMTSLYAELALEQQGKIPTTALHDQENMESYLKSQWGASYEGTVRAAQEAARSLGPKFLAWLGETRLGNDPAMLITLAGLSKDGMFRTMTPAKAREEIAAMRANKNHSINKPGSSDRTAWMARYRMLSALAHSEESEVSPKDRKLGAREGNVKEMVADRTAKEASGDSPQAKLEAELKQLRLDPAYYDKSKPNNKAVVERVRAIYRELYP
jgi:hypothetical protein